MKLASLYIFFFVVFVSLDGCGEPRDKLALHDVHWDRDMCERCKMVTSDRHHTVQAVDSITGKSYMFDDIGCMLLWFDEEQVAWSDKAKIYITDVKTGKWIDAREAYYSSNNITPMAYGFAAHLSKSDIKQGEDILKFEELLDKVIAIEKKINSNYGRSTK